MKETDIIQKTLDLLRQNDEVSQRYKAEIINFETRLDSAQNNNYRLGVIGVTSSGKSTMINSLLGEALLPSGARPSTNQLVCCHAGRERLAKVFFDNGLCKEYRGAKLNSIILSKYGDEQGSNHNKENVKQIEIISSRFPLPPSILLIDSPGLDAFGFDGHEKLTMNSLLPTVDFCLFVTTCKTNSDEKMLSVLNTIAEYDKPVIIIQNMIDTLRPSLDGTKSVTQIAQNHLDRLHKVVANSDIKDKSAVRVVQISAIKALNAQIKQNRPELTESNFQTLIDAITSTFSSLKPSVEGHRLNLLRKEISRIADQAIKDGKGGDTSVAQVFPFDRTIEELKSTHRICCTNLKNFKQLDSAYQDFSKRYSIYQIDIERLKRLIDAYETELCQRMKDFSEKITRICNQLNVDNRDIFSNFSVEHTTLSLRTKEQTKTVRIPANRKLLNPFTWFNRDKFVTTSETVTDVEATKKAAKSYIESVKKSFERVIDKWSCSIDRQLEKLAVPIENRRAEYEARRKSALDKLKYLEIGKALSDIAKNIPVFNAKKSGGIHVTTTVSAPRLFEMKTENFHYSYALVTLSKTILGKIHRMIFSNFWDNSLIHRKKVVYGWDKSCEITLLRYAFGIIKDDASISDGINTISPNIELRHNIGNVSESYYKGNNKNMDADYVVLFNATQYGAALKQLASCGFVKSMGNKCRIFYVVQDLEEILNGESLEETMVNMKVINNSLHLNVPYSVLMLHENPIYNLAAVECQTIGCKTQADEVSIIHNLQNIFGYLFPINNKVIIEKQIKTIIQKLG